MAIENRLPKFAMRLFFALWPPTDIAQRLSERARSVADMFGGRPTRQETLHLTLAFIGEVSDERLSELVQSAQTVRAMPFDLDINRLGYWHHNHLIWAGVSPSEPLAELAGQLKRVLLESGFVNDKDKHGFAPHLSLVRKVPDADALVLPPVEPARWFCDRFVLVCSQRSSTPPFYETVSEFPLTDVVPARALNESRTG
jgi:RNA 2',3'-cyclic 3'-phosphodiesterase